MSYTEIYKVPAAGEMECIAEIDNAWRGAMHIWCEMALHYLNLDYAGLFTYLCKPDSPAARILWDLYLCEDIPLAHRITFASTFDKVMVKRDHLPRLIAAFKQFAQDFPPGNILEQAEALQQLIDDPTCVAVCWNHTSVNCDTWRVLEPDGINVRCYDLNRDTGHYFSCSRTSWWRRSNERRALYASNPIVTALAKPVQTI